MRNLPQILLPALLLAGFSLPAAAQGGSLSGPVLGYAPDGSGVRPIRGVPGASLMGEHLPLGFPASAVEVSPGQDYVLAVSAEDGQVRVVGLGVEPLAARALEGIASAPDRVVLSPRGSAALFVRSEEGLAWVVKGLPSAPVTAALDLAGVSGRPNALAVSDDGSTVLAATTDGLFLVTAEGVTPLPSVGAITALAFLPGSLDAVAAGGAQVAVLSDTAGQPAWRVAGSFTEDFGDAIAVAAAGGRAFVAGNRAVAVVDLTAGAVSELAASCQVTGLARLSGDAFRLTGVSSEPVWMVEGGTEPRLLFVPPAPPAPAAAEEESR